MYAVKNSVTPTELARKMKIIFLKQGFELVRSNTSSSTDQTFGYRNLSIQKIVLVDLQITHSGVYMSFTGN